MTTRLPVVLLLATWCALAAAQGTVYESKDKAGPVFSDRPSSGAQPIDLPAPSAIQTETPRQPPAPAVPAGSYTLLAITVPANGDTIHSNTGMFDVSVRISPALRTAAGDRIKVRLDGNLTASSYPSAGFSVAAADWQAAANSDNVEHTLRAAIIDATGTVLLESAPITFYARRATVRRRER